MHSDRVKMMVYIALGAVILAICSWIMIPAPVPFTMQTFGVFALLLILGGKAGTASIGLYLGLGMVGVPVYSGFSGGIGHIAGPTGGYLIGFLILGLVYWLLSCIKAKYIRVLSLTVGMICCYLFGTFWYVMMYAGASQAGFGAVLMTCVIPYILPDALKMALALVVSKRIKRRI